MYRPISPCKDCKKRALDACLECEDWKEYKAKMLECYEAEHRDRSVNRAVYEALDNRAREKHKKKGYRNFIKR